MFLVDTNVISEIRKGDRCDPNVRRWYDEVPDPDLFTSVLVLGEIRRGVDKLRAKDGTRAKALDAWLNALRDGFRDRIAPIDLPVAITWGELNARRPYPVIDGLLAATAITHDFILVTRNVEDIRGTGARYLDPFRDRRVRVAR